MNKHFGIGKPRISMPKTKLLHVGEELSMWKEVIVKLKRHWGPYYRSPDHLHVPWLDRGTSKTHTHDFSLLQQKGTD